MNEQTDRDDAAKHRCYGKRDQVKIGETRFQVEMHPRLHTRIRATRLCGAAHRPLDGCSVIRGGRGAFAALVRSTRRIDLWRRDRAHIAS